MLGRTPPARRLTQSIDGGKRAPAAPSRDGGTISSHKPLYPELLSVVTSGGGGLEQSLSVQIGGLHACYGVHTHAGADPNGSTKENQDAWCVQERIATQDMVLFGVFDGHGQEGSTVSHHICQALPPIAARLLTAARALQPPGGVDAMETCLARAFPEANASLRHCPCLDASLSGSTGVAALLSADRVAVANLGDSRCVLGRVDARGQATAVPLSSDHTPLDPAEAQRVEASGGRIACFMWGDEPLGPPRVWLRDVNVPGLCMTRSFGDYVAASVGVLDTPTLVTAALRPEDRYLLLMSDGIFEFIDSQKIIEEVHAAARAGLPPCEAAKRIVLQARRCWQEQEEIIDDCTALVIYLTHADSSSSGSREGTGIAATLAARLEGQLRMAGPQPAPGPAASGSGSGSSGGSGSGGDGGGGGAIAGGGNGSCESGGRPGGSSGRAHAKRAS